MVMNRFYRDFKLDTKHKWTWTKFYRDLKLDTNHEWSWTHISNWTITTKLKWFLEQFHMRHLQVSLWKQNEAAEKARRICNILTISATRLQRLCCESMKSLSKSHNFIKSQHCIFFTDNHWWETDFINSCWLWQIVLFVNWIRRSGSGNEV